MSKTKNENRVSFPRAVYREITMNKVALISFIFILIVVLGSIIGSFFIDQNETFRVTFSNKNLPPLSIIDDKLYILGSDRGGKDIFSLLVLGTRNSLFIGWSIALFSGIIGVTVGLISGFFGKTVDNVIMRTVDFIMVIPQTMFMIALIVTIKDYTVFKFIMILVLFQWLRYVRIIRAKALQESSQEYIMASKVLGTPTYKIIFREMLPNLMSIIILRMTLAVALSIGIETGLTYLGYGLPANVASLGTLVNYAKETVVMEKYWWTWLPATILILFLMLAISNIGQALKRACDSRQRI